MEGELFERWHMLSATARTGNTWNKIKPKKGVWLRTLLSIQKKGTPLQIFHTPKLLHTAKKPGPIQIITN